MELRRALHALGWRYRVHQRPLPTLRRTADVVFRSAKVAVFVDGCYWHGCAEHGTRKHEVNRWYWPAKIERNVQRDRDTDEQLAANGWVVIRIWEHETPQAAAQRVVAIVEKRRGRLSGPPAYPEGDA